MPEVFHSLTFIVEGREVSTLLQSARKRVAAERGGEASLKPWNLSHALAGDVEKVLARTTYTRIPAQPWGLSFIDPAADARCNVHGSGFDRTMHRHLPDNSQELDPYYPFEEAVDVWARTFAALGINYKV